MSLTMSLLLLRMPLHPQTDEFKLDLGQNNLGKINKVDIGFATQQTVSGKLGSIFGQQWNLASVEVGCWYVWDEAL